MHRTTAAPAARALRGRPSRRGALRGRAYAALVQVAIEDCFERQLSAGPHHGVGLDPLGHDRRRFLLTHHRKLERWLQLGGHADGDPDVLQVALREAREESGMATSTLVSVGERDPVPARSMPHPSTSTCTGSRRGPASRRTSTTTSASCWWPAPGQPLRVSDESNDAGLARGRSARRGRRRREPAAPGPTRPPAGSLPPYRGAGAPKLPEELQGNDVAEGKSTTLMRCRANSDLVQIDEDPMRF